MFHSRALWAVLAGITFASISTAATVKTTSPANKTSPKTTKVVKTKSAKNQAKAAHNCPDGKCEDKKSCPMKTKTAKAKTEAKTEAKVVLKCCEHEGKAE